MRSYVDNTGVKNKGPRYVAFCRERGVYLNFSCTGDTPDRVWAWSGTIHQARNMRRLYPYSREFDIYRNGEEKFG